MPTDVELFLSPALPPRGFDEVPEDLVDPAGDVGATTRGGQIWRPFRFRLIEGLCELPRLELWATRREGFRPASQDDGQSIFDRMKQRAGRIRNDNSQLDNAWNRLSDDWDKGSYTALPGDVFNPAVPAAAGPNATPGGIVPEGADLLNSVIGGVGGGARDVYNTFSDWDRVKEDVLGLGVPGEPWPGNPPPSPLELLGTQRSVRFARRDASADMLVHGRWFTGIVSEFEDLGSLLNAYRAIRLVIVPSLYRLSLRKDCRIFQEVDAQTIVGDVLARAGLYTGSVDWRPLPSPLPKREYCVQWNETDLAFVQRILEEEGLVYWFEHRKGAEKLVIADGASVGDTRFQAMDTLGSLSNDLPHRAVPNPQDARNEEATWSFRVANRIQPTKVSIRDFNFSDPRNYVRDVASAAGDSAQLTEISEYELRPALLSPADPEWAYKPVDPPRKAAQHRLDAIVAGQTTARGESNAVALAPGRFITVVEDRGSQLAGTPVPVTAGAIVPEGSFLVTHVEHYGLLDEAAVGPGESTGSVPMTAGYQPPNGIPYANTFRALPGLPGMLRFRVLPTVPRPRIPGVQTAIVLGPEATDPVESLDRRQQVDWIHLDPLGRIQVRFPWDRRADAEQPEPYARGRSAWLRVAGPWAGDGYGVSFVPRANMEVVVGFEQGDPDRPLVLGAVHNRSNPYPVERKHIDHAKPNVLGKSPSPDDERVYYKLDTVHEAKPTLDLNLIRTRSHLGTSSAELRADGYNELSFHDASGSERIRIHAERDLVEDVQNDHTTVVQGDQLNVVGHDHDEKVGKCAGVLPTDRAAGEQRESESTGGAGAGSGSTTPASSEPGAEPAAGDEGGKQTLEVGGNRRKVVVGSEKTTVEKNRKVEVLGSEALRVLQNRTEKVVGEESVQIGAGPTSVELRFLDVHGHRQTKVSGNDELEVLIDQTVTVGGAFSMSGASVSMVVTTPPGAPPGAKMEIDPTTGVQTVSAKGEPGTIHLTAHGGDPEQPESTTGTMELLAQKHLKMESGASAAPGGVRFECGDDVWLEVGPEGIKMHAPKRVLFKCGASELQVEHAGDHERVVLSTRTTSGQPEAFWMSLEGGGAGDAPDVSDDDAGEAEVTAQEIDAKAEDSFVATEKTLRSDDVGYVEPGTELPEPGAEDAWQMPGIILTTHDLDIEGGAVVVSSQKGVNIQAEKEGELVTTRLLSKSERDVIEALEGAQSDLKEMESELESQEEPLAEKKKAFDDQAEKTKEKKDAAFGSGGTDERWRKTCRDLQNAADARKAAETKYQEAKEDYDEAKEEGVVEDEDWKFDEAKTELEKAKKREEEAKEAEQPAAEEHKKAREELGEEEQKLADVQKDYEDAKREHRALEKRIDKQREMVAMFEDEAAKRTAPRTNG